MPRIPVKLMIEVSCERQELNEEFQGITQHKRYFRHAVLELQAADQYIPPLMT
jgi:hypothetical protein